VGARVTVVDQTEERAEAAAATIRATGVESWPSART